MLNAYSQAVGHVVHENRKPKGPDPSISPGQALTVRPAGASIQGLPSGRCRGPGACHAPWRGDSKGGLGPPWSGEARVPWPKIESQVTCCALSPFNHPPWFLAFVKGRDSRNRSQSYRRIAEAPVNRRRPTPGLASRSSRSPSARRRRPAESWGRRESRRQSGPS